MNKKLYEFDPLVLEEELSKLTMFKYNFDLIFSESFLLQIKKTLSMFLKSHEIEKIEDTNRGYNLQERFAFVCEKYDEELKKNAVLEDKILDQDKHIEQLMNSLDNYMRITSDYFIEKENANSLKNEFEAKVLDQDKLIEILKRRIEIHEQTIKDYGQALSHANTFKDALHMWLIDNGDYG